MRTKKNIAGIFALAWLVAWTSVAQERDVKAEKYRVVNLNMKQGVPPGIYSSIIKDAFGFVWFGGRGGLFRFDGTTSDMIVPDKVKVGAINTDAIYGFVEDSLKNIWMGTRMGLSRYDIIGNKFINFNSDNDSIMAPIVSRDGAIVPFWTTATHVYCFEAHAQRIVTYDIRSFEKKVVFVAHDSNKLKIDGISIRSICLETESNSIWMLYNDPQDVQGILRVSLDDGKTQLYTWPCLGNKAAHRHNAEAMVMDSKRKSIWINSGDGLVEFSLTTKQFSHIDAFRELRALPDYDRYVGINIDRKGNIIMATRPTGILLYDPIKNVLKPIMSDRAVQQGVGQNNLQIYCDRDGIVWASDYLANGVVELLPVNPSVRRYAANPGIKDSLSNGQIFNIVNGAQGKVWLGTGDGLNIFDPRTEKFEVLRERDLPGIKGEIIIPLHVDTLQQKAWLSTSSSLEKYYERDLYELDIKTKKCTPIIFRNGSTRLGPGFVQVTQGYSRYKNGLMVYSHKMLFEVIPGKPFADVMISLKTPYKISELELEDEKFIFTRSYDALPNESFEMKNGLWTKIPHLLDTLPWLSMVYNQVDKTHWISFENELTHYDKDFRLIKTYTSGDRNVGEVYEMLLDLKGNLWFINQLGYVGRLDKDTGTITYLSEADGYRNKSFDWATPIINDARGNLYLGTGYTKGSEGLDVINVNVYSPSPPPLIYLRSLRVNQQSYSLSERLEVSLSHDENNLFIEARVIDPYSIGNSKMRHRLEKNGHADDWEVGGTYHTIQYQELPPGEYRLVIQASSGGNNFTTEKVVSITINAPYWESWWFRTLSVLVVIGATYSIVQYRSRSLLARERLKSDLRIAQVQQEKEHFELEKAKEIDKVKSTFFANISHEFRTPLALIKGPVQETLEESTNNPKLQERMKLVLRNADLVLKLINQLLDLAKLDSGTLTVEKSENDLNAFLRVVTNSFSSLAFQKNIVLEAELPPQKYLVSFDEDKVETILINLINNAIKFTQAGGTVKVRVVVQRAFNQTQDELVMTVSDNGIGIDIDQHERIFERFHQVSESHKEVGTGIGLSLVKELVALMKGTVSLESEPGKGSEFTVTLPLEVTRLLTGYEEVTEVQSQLVSQELTHRLKKNGEQKYGDLPRILVVEDHSDLRRFIINSLGTEFHFLEAANGKQGLETALEETPDLIISDVMMPEMDGITMTGKIKSDIRTSHIPLILLTAKTSDESKVAGLSTGADDYLTKPFNKNELLLKVRNRITHQVKLREKIKLELLKGSPKVDVQSADETFLLKVREAILARLSDEQLSVESLADEMALSRSHLFRKITALTGVSVNELIRTFRLQRAAQLLEQNWAPVTQVAYEVGFSNLSYFSKAFKEKYGVAPSEYPSKTI